MVGTKELPGPIGLMELERIVRDVDPRVVLLPQRILRRVIKHDRKMTSLGLQVPHSQTYLLDSAVAAQVLARDELGLAPDAELPPGEPLILIQRPEPAKLARVPRTLTLRHYWRLLFHARLDLELDERRASGLLDDEAIRSRILEIGPTAFDEARAILRYEDYLLPPRDQWTTYREFVSVFLELNYFACRLLPAYFPALADSEAVAALLVRDTDASALYEATYLPGAAAPEADPAAGLDPDLAFATPPLEPLRLDTPATVGAAGSRPSERAQRSLRHRADRAEARGNLVRAAIRRERAGRGPAEAGDAEAARDLLRRLSDRLRLALGQPAAEANAWFVALEPLMAPASRGLWSVEARLLFDLQRACLDHERPVFNVDLVEWFLSGFQRPIKRPLPIQREVLMSKHLATAAHRVLRADLNSAQRSRLASLLNEAVDRSRTSLRDVARPRIAGALDSVGLRPQTVAERVASAKVVEELLDQVVDRGYMSMGHLRDAIARNNLKLPDLSGAPEFFSGDRLLQADRRLGLAIDGVYRRGEVYLRWLQRFSSLGFGTPAGRFITHYVALPFGGAFVLLKGVDSLVAELIHLVSPPPPPPAAAQAHAEVPHAPPAVDEATLDAAAVADEAATLELAGPPTSFAPLTLPREFATSEPFDGSSLTTTEDAPAFTAVVPDVSTAEPELTASTLAAPPGHDDKHTVHIIPPHTLPWATLAFGILLMGLLHAPRFRALVQQSLRVVYRSLRSVLVDLPHWVVSLPLVSRFLQTRVFLFLWRMIVKPLVPSLLVWAWLRRSGVGGETARSAALTLFVTVGLFLSLRIGRDLEEISSDWLVRTWRVIRVNLVSGLYHAIVDVFGGLLEWVDGLLYRVDEWLRFRGGESRLIYWTKAVLGVAWFYATYAIRFAVNLLVEPQINPIKHFPVVTVSHKVMAPYLFMLLYVGLKDRLGDQEAGLLYFVVQLLLPGVFGFLVWELKENYRLYQANQPESLRPVVVGHHGETMLRLLKPGLHSGTVPKLFMKLRHAERQALLRGEPRRLAVGRLREKFHHVEESVRQFLDRELVTLLAESRALGGRPLQIGRIEMSTNRIRAEIRCRDLRPEPALFRFEFRSGWLLAGLEQAGWIDDLDPDERRVLAASLAGLYQLSAVDLVAQDLDATLPVPSRELEFNDQGLLFWAGDRLQSEVSYALNDRPRLVPSLVGPLPPGPLPILEADQVLLPLSPISWARWVATWEAEHAGQSPPDPYLAGFVLLPPEPPPPSALARA